MLLSAERNKTNQLWTDRFVPPPVGQSIVDYVLSEYELPWPLRSHQVSTINELGQYDASGCYLDVGTGKTVVSTMLALYFGLRGDIDQVIVIMPPILLRQWHNWIKTFPELSVTVYQGPPAKRKAMSLQNDVILVSLGIFKNDFVRISKELGNANMFVIVDEAAKIRRISTQNYKAVRDFLGMGKKYFSLLTGTPINNPTHCYPYIKLLVPSAYRDWSQFVLHHVTANDVYGEACKFKNLDRLAENMAYYSVRIEADDVLDLPEITYDPLVYDLDPKHKRLYDKLVMDLLLTLDDGRLIDGTTSNRLYHAVQELILRPAEFGGGTTQPAGFRVLENMIDEAGVLENRGEKLIVYCHHKSANQALTDFANRIKGVNAVQAYGGQSPNKNLNNVQRFLDDPSVNTLIANPGSVGIGLNLQGVCRAMLFLELPITANDFVQAIGRIKREGQMRKCLIRLAIAAGTIQEHLAPRVVKKEDVVQKIMPTKETIRRALTGLKNI